MLFHPAARFLPVHGTNQRLVGGELFWATPPQALKAKGGISDGSVGDVEPVDGHSYAIGIDHRGDPPDP